MRSAIARCLPQLLLGLAALAVLTGCSTTERRIARNQAYFDDRPEEIQQTIRQGKVELGFTKQDVYISLGAPDAKYTRTTEAGENEIWGYWSYEPSVSFYHHHYYGHRHRHRDLFHDPWYGHGFHGYNRRDRYERLRIVFDNGMVSAIERQDRPW